MSTPTAPAARPRRRLSVASLPGGRRTVAILALLVAVTAVGGVRRFDRAAHHAPARSADEKAYLSLAVQIARHASYGSAFGKMQDPVHWPPGTPALFALAERAGGSGGAAPQAVYTTQAITGTLTILAAFAAAALLAGALAGLVAAAATSFYPPLVETAGHALSEPLGALGLALAAVALAAAARRPSAGRFAAAGVLLGLTLLTRADLGPAVPFLALWAFLLVRRTRGPRTALVHAAVLLGVTVLVIAPWAAYASHRAHKLVPISTGGSSALYAGTYLPGDGTVFGLKRAFADQVRLQDARFAHKTDPGIPERIVLDLIAARHPGASEDAALRSEAAHNIRDGLAHHPLSFLRMLGAKAARMWTTPTRGPFRKLRADRLAVHIVLVGLALLGALAAALLLRRRTTGVGAVLTVVAVSTVTNAIFLSEPRHLLSLLPALFAAGAAGWALVLARRSVAGAPAPSASAGQTA